MLGNESILNVTVILSAFPMVCAEVLGGCSCKGLWWLWAVVILTRVIFKAQFVYVCTLQFVVIL